MTTQKNRVIQTKEYTLSYSSSSGTHEMGLPTSCYRALLLHFSMRWLEKSCHIDINIHYICIVMLKVSWHL